MRQTLEIFNVIAILRYSIYFHLYAIKIIEIVIQRIWYFYLIDLLLMNISDSFILGVSFSFIFLKLYISNIFISILYTHEFVIYCCLTNHSKV